MLNNFKLNKHKAALTFIILALLINLCCGKRKPPLPPIEKISQRVEVLGTQKGNQIILSWEISENVDQSNLNIVRTDVYRLIEPISSPLALSEEEFSSNSVLIASLPVTGNEIKSKKMTFNDTLEFAGQAVRLRYSLRFVNSSGQKAAFSNFLLIEPTAKIAQSPTNLKATAGENFIRLDWITTNDNVDGSKPADILGYNIYRLSDTDSVKLLNTSPLSEKYFLDKFFEFEKAYKYFVRTVSLGTNGEPVESKDSDSVEIIARDVFPPDAPGAITIAAAPNNLSIFFAFNSENDIAGYKIYRSEISNQPISQWTLLTADLLKTNTFQDTSVKSGKTYFYYLIAVDKAGNISKPSDIVSETAP